MKKVKTLNPFTRKHFSAAAAIAILIALGLGCASKSDNEWKYQLGGRKLTKAGNSGAISNRVDIYFCSNGDYALQTQFSGFSTGGAGTLSMADEDVEYGRWTVESNVLVMQSQDGSRREYALSEGQDASVIYLDGTGYLLTVHGECED